MNAPEVLDMLASGKWPEGTLVATNGNALRLTVNGMVYNFRLEPDGEPYPNAQAARLDEISRPPSQPRAAAVRPVASQSEPFTPNPTLVRAIENSSRFLLPIYAALPGGRIVAGIVGFTPFGVVQDADGSQSIVFAFGTTVHGPGAAGGGIQAGPTNTMSNITPAVMFRLKLHGDMNPGFPRGPVPAQLEVATFHKLPSSAGKLSDAEVWLGRMGVQAVKMNTRILEAEMSLEEARREEAGGRPLSTDGNAPELLYPPLALGKPERENSPVVTSANFAVDRRLTAIYDGENGGYIFPDDPRHVEMWDDQEHEDGEHNHSSPAGVAPGEPQKPQGGVSLYPEE